MKKFEIGKIYGTESMKYKVIKRTAKRVTVNVIAHFGKFNEHVLETKTYKIYDWETREVFHTSTDTIEA